MTRFILYILLLSPSTSFGQNTLPDTLTKIQVTPTFWATPGKSYVDSIQMDMTKTYLDPKNIKEVKTFKGQDAKLFSGARGAVLITRKKQHPFASLADIIYKSQQANDKNLPVVYVIDGIAQSDTAFIRFEPTSLKSISILKNSEEGVQHDPPKIVYLIKTKRGPLKRRENGY